MSKVTDGVTLLAVGVVGYVAWTVYKTFRENTVSGVISTAVNATADAVDMRETAPNSLLGQSQGWFADTVQKGQDDGADTFIGAFFTGLFK